MDAYPKTLVEPGAWFSVEEACQACLLALGWANGVARPRESARGYRAVPKGETDWSRF